MSNLWVDLTDLFEWNGHFTGIQRVTYNYASRFEQEGARFFVYSNTNDRFVEISFELLEQLPEETPRRRLIKQKLKRYYMRIPKRVRSLIQPLLHATNRVFRRLAAVALDSKSRYRFIRNMPSVAFAKNDTVLLLGAGWNSKGLVESLGVQKQTYELSVVVHLNDILPVYQSHLFAEELPKMFFEYTKKTLKKADLVTVISEATKQDVLRFCSENNIKLPPVEVVRLGENITSAVAERPRIKLNEKFILCVGTLEIRKNYILLYQAVKLAQQEGKKLPQIVIAGRRGWLTHDLQYVIDHDSAVAGKLVLLENMSDANISWLYDHCMFTVFASLAEGWGLPIAESLQHGRFCLSSNTSSMPEIAGSSIDYFSPFDARGCLDKIVHYANRNRYSEKNELIRKNYKVFTWDASYITYKKIVSTLWR